MKAVKEAINLLESITNSKVVLKEDVFTDFLSKGKQPKAVRDTIEKLQSWQKLERIPEREWNKLQTVAYKIAPVLKVIFPKIVPGDFPLYDKRMAEFDRLCKKYGGDAVVDFYDKMSKPEMDAWQKLLKDTESEQYSFYEAQRLQKRGEEVNGVFVPCKIWKQLKVGDMLPENTYHGYNISNEKKLTDLANRLSQGLKIIASAKLSDAVKVYQFDISEIQKYIPIAQQVAQFKLKVETGREQKMREKKQEIKGSVNPIIYQQVEVIAEDFRKVIEANQIKYYTDLRTEFLSASKVAGSNDLYVIFPIKMLPVGKHNRMEDKNDSARGKWNAVLHFQPRKGYDKVSLVTPKTDAEIQKMAFDESTEEAKRFLIKMADKLGGIFKDINVSLEITKLNSRSLRTNELKFSINGGESSFLIQNQITQGFSNLGTFFYRYPTTFHNAIVKGVRVKAPDEVTVKQALVQAYHI
jgi:hypothetical protein